MPSNQYSPTAEQPYQPTVAPEIIQPTPSPVAPQNPAPTGIQAAGNISHVGAVAGIADNILRGFMQGRAQRDARQAMTTKRQTDIMEASYNSAASQLLQMHRDGVDPNSTEYKQAKDAVDGSFAAKNAYYAQHVLAGDQKPKKGKKGEQEPTSIGEMVQSKDPAVQAKGWLLLQQKAGPPVYHQIASSSTPAAVAARATADTQGATAQSSANTQNAMAKMAEQITNLSVKPNLTSDEKTQLESLKNKYTDLRDTLNPPKTPAGGTHRYSDDGKEEYEVDVEGREVPGTRRPRSIVQAAGPKVGTFGAFMKAGYGEDPSVEDYEQGRALWAKSGAGTTVGTHQIAVAQPDGSTRLVTVESTSTKTFPGAGPQAPNSPAAPPRQQGPGRTAPGGPPKAGGGPPGRLVGGHVVTQFSQVEKDTHEAYQKAKDKYNAAITYIDDQVSNPKTKAAWPPTRVSMERKKAADALEQENKGIASLNSARTRDLGGIPGDDQQHPAAAAHQPESTHGSEPPSGATAPVYGEDGHTLIGYVVDGVFQYLKK